MRLWRRSQLRQGECEPPRPGEFDICAHSWQSRGNVVVSDSRVPGKPAAALPGGKTSFSAFRNRSFLLFAISRTLAVIAIEMVSVAVGWQIYDLTHKPLSLGLAGLAQCIPGILLFLVAGHVADHCSRKRLLVACSLGYAFCATLLLHFALRGVATVGPIYLAVLLIGVVRTFEGPVRASILTEIVPEESFATAVAWLGSIQKTATMTGPMLGGLIYALGRGPKPVYVAGVIGGVVAAAFAAPIAGRPRPLTRGGTDLRTVLAGLHYIREHRIILGGDFAGSVRGAAGRRGGTAAGVCPRHPADRTVGTGPAAQRAGDWRYPDGRVGGALATARQRRQNHVVVRRGLRHGDNCVRLVPQSAAFDGGAADSGRAIWSA